MQTAARTIAGRPDPVRASIVARAVAAAGEHSSAATESRGAPVEAAV